MYQPNIKLLIYQFYAYYRSHETEMKLSTICLQGLAAIHISAIHGRLDCLKWLIEHFKVDVNCRSSDGWTPLHLCISNQTGRRSFDCLLYLLQHGANPSVYAQFYFETPSNNTILCLFHLQQENIFPPNSLAPLYEPIKTIII